jgi:oxygen-dependent protoporphyrinogen oxidase
MPELSEKSNQVIVIGGGITGLSACWYLQTQTENPPSITLIESSAELGGKMVTQCIQVRGDTFIIDAGPESFVTRKPEAWELAMDLDLEDQIINPGSETRNMYVLNGGTPKKIPLSLPAFIGSNLLSIRGKVRMIIEPLIPPRRDYEDESLADFVTRRLGSEALEKMIGPVLAGIYNTDPRTQSIMTTSPVMREMEKEHGSLFRGAFARMRARRKVDSGAPRPPQFMTFKNGAQVMVDTLEYQLSVQIIKSNPARLIEKMDAGYSVVIDDHERLYADAVILAVPGNQASKLLSQVNPQSANLIGKIEHKNIGTATLIYDSDQVDIPYEINGLMIPRREKRRIDAVTWTSNKPIPRAPRGYEMVRVFFGGGDSSIVSLAEEKIIEVIRTELEEILGLTAVPLATAVFCWPDSFPQAYVGHLNLVNQIEANLPQGLYVAGSSYRGIGIPDCIRQGRVAACKVLEFLKLISEY